MFKLSAVFAVITDYVTVMSSVTDYVTVMSSVLVSCAFRTSSMVLCLWISCSLCGPRPSILNIVTRPWTLHVWGCHPPRNKLCIIFDQLLLYIKHNYLSRNLLFNLNISTASWGLLQQTKLTDVSHDQCHVTQAGAGLVGSPGKRLSSELVSLCRC